MSMVPAHSRPLAIRDWNDDKLRLLKQQAGAKGLTDLELEYFIEHAVGIDLNPLIGETVAIKYGNEMSIQVTVEGLFTLAERSGLLAGHDPPEWADDNGVWHDVWLPKTTKGTCPKCRRQYDVPPAAARRAVHRKDWDRPSVGVARYASFVQLNKHGEPRPPWDTGPDFMLEKVATARALRAAFSKEFTRAGVSARNLSDAQIVAVEARRAGLGDEQRHELIAEVTQGRTDSSTDLDDQERIAVRSRVAALPDDEPDAEPDDGEPDDAEVVEEVPDPPADGELRRVSQASPTGTETFYVDETTGERLSQGDGERREREQLVARLRRDVPGLNALQRSELDQYRRDCKIDPAQPASAYTLEQLHLVDAWLDNTFGEPF